ncbi:hypothetical protein AVEN_104432-1, partial [Araneus ventricosus]
MQLEFPSFPKSSGIPDEQHDSTSQHLAGEEFAQLTRHQTPQMQAQLHNEKYLQTIFSKMKTRHASI